MTSKNSIEPLLFASSYAGEGEGAIEVFRLDLDRGQLVLVSRVTGLEYPLFLALSRDERFLYSTEEPRGVSSEVAAYKISPISGNLTHLNRQPTQGRVACYIKIADSGKCLLIAHYGSGSIAIVNIRENGTLQEPLSLPLSLRSPADSSKRQKTPLGHCIIFSRDGRFVFASDLGNDRIQCYRVLADRPRVLSCPISTFDTYVGSGPRHLVFSLDGRFLYIINEVGNTITVAGHESESGFLNEHQVISTLPEDFSGDSHAGDLQMSIDGRFLYATNRGHDSIAIYCICEDGRLALTAIESSRGESPQSLAISNCGRFLLSANLLGDCIAVFKINLESGHLSAIGTPVQIRRPSCIVISHQ